jgi:L-2-hydroxycarboxylate dehydrogenase (NAD+)
LIDEIFAACIGGSLPTLRCRPTIGAADEKRTPAFFFQCIRPEAIACDFAKGRTQSENLKAVLKDVVGHGNDNVLFPGEPEARAAAQSEKLGGLLFTAAEIDAFDHIAAEAGQKLDRAALRTVEI